MVARPTHAPGRSGGLAPAGSAAALLIPEGIEPKKFRAMPVPVQTMLKRMSSSRQRSSQTLISYGETATRFFQIVGGVHAPTEQDWHDYFMVRRRQGVAERTLAKEFAHLKKLAETNHYRWPFSKEDVPHTVEEPYTPTFSPPEVEQLIRAWPLYTVNERLYLACSTIWGLRVNELIAISRRDYDSKTVLFHKSKREKSVRHLIPDELKPIFAAAKPSLSDRSSASFLFNRICLKAKIKRQRRQSFHSIRHSVTTVLSWAIAEHKLDGSLIGEWMGWAKARSGEQYGGSAMVGTYRNHGAMTNDPYWLDKLILPVHPFLKLWKGVTGDDPK